MEKENIEDERPTTHKDLRFELAAQPKHVKPKTKFIKAPYIPISAIEARLTEIFGPLGWQVKNFRWTVVLNEVMGAVELWVKNPVDGEWICREGSGAAQITMNALTKEEKDAGKKRKATDIEEKQLNAMETASGHLLSDCLKNAAKKYGTTFGANIGRKEEDRETTSKEAAKVEFEEFKNSAETATDLDDLDRAVKALPAPIAAEEMISRIYDRNLERLMKPAIAAGTEQPQTLFIDE